MKSIPLSWKRIVLISVLLLGGSTVVLALLRQGLPNPRAEGITYLQKDYSPDEYRAIQLAFWQVKGRQRACAHAYVDKYMSMLRADCEASEDTKTISGGCGHMTNPLNYPEITEAGLQHCGILP
jgi:hypothetical protein